MTQPHFILLFNSDYYGSIWCKNFFMYSLERQHFTPLRVVVVMVVELNMLNHTPSSK